MTDRDFLLWIHNRLRDVHGEEYGTDYMNKLRCIAEVMPEGQETPNVLEGMFVVSEHLPEEDKIVMVRCCNGDVMKGFYRQNVWSNEANNTQLFVTHWKEIPFRSVKPLEGSKEQEAVKLLDRLVELRIEWWEGENSSDNSRHEEYKRFKDTIADKWMGTVINRKGKASV